MLKFPIKVFSLPGIDISALTVSFNSIFTKNINNISNIYIKLEDEPKLFVQTDEPSTAQNLEEQNPQNIPFQMGVHFIVNQNIEWYQEIPESQRTIEQVKFVPIMPNNKMETVHLIGKAPQLTFKICCTKDGDLAMTLPKGENIGPHNDISSGDEINESDETVWKFHKYMPDEFIRLNTLGDAVLSFDDNVVSAAWLLERNRDDDDQQQYFIVLVGLPSV